MTSEPLEPARAPEPGEWVTAIAPAKINPYLEILGKREDGFHELVTCMVCLTLSDRVRVRVTDHAGRIDLNVHGPEASADIPRDERNLVVRIARDVLTQARMDCGVEIDLEKNVPSQSGMGGASADAAACLVALSCALRLPTSRRQSELLLAQLGSDCVFFASAATTGFGVCEGRGEKVTPYPALDPEWHVALVVPEVRCPTADVYHALGFPLSARPSRHSFDASLLRNSAVAARPWLKNDLEHPALRCFSELAAWRDRLDECGSSHFRLTGSGATFFGLFDDADAARTSLRTIEDATRAVGLGTRASFVVRTAGHGVRLV